MLAASPDRSSDSTISWRFLDGAGNIVDVLGTLDSLSRGSGAVAAPLLALAAGRW